MRQRRERVAIIGGGPGGLVAARYLKAHGFDPVIFDAAGWLGGQWNADGERSAMWPGLRAGSRVTTRFSDLDFPAEVAAAPTGADVLAYLETYAEAFGLAECLRLGIEVETLARHPAGRWAIHSRQPGAPPRTETFERVVVATGRRASKCRTDVPGLPLFGGAVSHSLDYDGAEPFARKTVLVAGRSAAARAIVADLAGAGVAVVTTMPRSAGPETSRFEIWTGAPAPADLSDATPSGNCVLDLTAESLILLKPSVAGIKGSEIRFADGSSVTADAIILAATEEPDLSFLDRHTRALLGGETGTRIDLHDLTFHADLPGLAFVGFFGIVGATFPVLELQARWIAYAWAGLASLPKVDQMRSAVMDTAEERSAGALALGFARRAGVEPDLSQWPNLARALLFGPLSPAGFRLSGPDALAGAGGDVTTEAARTGTVLTPVFADTERRGIATLVDAGRTDLAVLLQDGPTDVARRAA